jgi:hypothetical protein
MHDVTVDEINGRWFARAPGDHATGRAAHMIDHLEYRVRAVSLPALASMYRRVVGTPRAANARAMPRAILNFADHRHSTLAEYRSAFCSARTNPVGRLDSASIRVFGSCRVDSRVARLQSSHIGLACGRGNDLTGSYGALAFRSVLR